MNMWHWLAVIFALVALHQRKRIFAIRHWHPAIILANAAVLAAAFAIPVGVYFSMVWLRVEIGLYPTAGLAFGSAAAFFVIYRVAVGRWPW